MEAREDMFVPHSDSAFPLFHFPAPPLRPKSWAMNLKLQLSVQLSLFSAGAMLCTNAIAAPAGYKLSWADEFEGPSLNPTNWSYRQLGARHDAINTTNAVSVGGGHLTITTYTADGKPRTGMIASQGKFERPFGYWEARIQFDGAPGMWSAFWLQSPTMGKAIGDPAAAGMEIDIIEHRFRDKADKDISGKGQLTLHWDGYGKDHKSKGELTSDLGLGQGFHTYGLEWTDREYRFYIDDKLTWTAPTPVSKIPEYILLSSEVRNKSWAGNIPEAGYGSLETSKTKMIVDYVRFYEKTAEGK